MSSSRIPNTPSEIAEQMVSKLIAGNDEKKLYDSSGGLDQVLIETVAVCDAAERDGFKNRLYARYPRFPRSQWTERIREARASKEKLKLVDAATRDPRPGYITSASGALKPCVANAITMMSELPISYDSFALKLVYTSASPWGASGQLTDVDDVRAAEWCQHQGLDISPSVASQAASVIGALRPFSPPHDYLRGLKWDGVPRLDTWLTTYLGVPDSDLHQRMGAKWMISAVNRVEEPGCQADYTLVLEGKQGKRKSSALRALAGDEWFSDDLAEIGTKDSAMQLTGKIIVEISELDAFRKAAMTTVKSWLVKRVDDFRPPYGRYTAKFPRQTVFAASTNKDDWGNDDTGLRRFWPVRVGEINMDALRRDRDQLWAEAFFRYSEGEKPFLSEHYEELAQQVQAQRQERDIWHDRVVSWLLLPLPRSGVGTMNFKSTLRRAFMDEVLEHCLGIPVKDQNPMNMHRVGRILKLEGYACHRVSRDECEDDGSRPRYWAKASGDV